YAILSFIIFFHTPTPPTYISTLSLHDALPIYVAIVLDFSKYMAQILDLDPERRIARVQPGVILDHHRAAAEKHNLTFGPDPASQDRKSTRLNSSHVEISYAVFCLKKKTKKQSK